MCAIINFTHKPILSDKPNTVEVAKLIKARCDQPQFNDLEFLLNKQLGTCLFEATNLESITNFVTLKRKQMTRFIFTGTFHLRRAKSYLVDLVRQNSAYNVNKLELIKLVKNLPDEDKYLKLRSYIHDPLVKIIVTKVISRHKRAVEKTPKIAKCKKAVEQNSKKKLIKNISKIDSVKAAKKKTSTTENIEKLELAKEAKCYKNKKIKDSYKVIICYLDQTPIDDSMEESQEKMEHDTNQSKRRPKKTNQIKSFICSCMNGKKITSPCMHISATIYYLGWAKYRPLKYPGEYLNEIFLQASDEPANNPK